MLKRKDEMTMLASDFTYHSIGSWLSHKLLVPPMPLTYSPKRFPDILRNRQPQSHLGDEKICGRLV
jgi:hypothetical protein